ncbi:MAG: hypothetical protein ACQESD_06460 [Thermoplasmatota archaeon]
MEELEFGLADEVVCDFYTSYVFGCDYGHLYNRYRTHVIIIYREISIMV